MKDDVICLDQKVKGFEMNELSKSKMNS